MLAINNKLNSSKTKSRNLFSKGIKFKQNQNGLIFVFAVSYEKPL